MHSFEGRFKSRRQPPYIPEQTNIVQKMQEERRVRAQNARLEKATITIQCFYRGYKTRRTAKDMFDKHFLQLSNVFLALSTDASNDPCLEKSMQSCLSAFLLCYRSGSPNFLMMARVLLTPTCKSIFIQSIQRGYSSLLATVKQTIVYFLSYLKSLPPLSSTDQYSIIIEVLDAYLFRSRSRQYSQSIPGAESDKFFLDVCKRGRYFSSLTVFIDRQSHFPYEFSSFALDEYIRMPNNRNFVYLIRTPFSLCSSKQSSSDVSPLQKIVSMAVKDIADVDEQNRSTESSRFLRFIFPLIGSSIPFETLVNYLYACASGETEAVQSIPENEYSKPSLNLLMVFLSGPIQRYLRERRLGSGSKDDHEVLLRVLRILAWMFSALIAARCPADGSTAVFSPPFPPEPLDGPRSAQTRTTKHSTILVDSVYADNDSDSDSSAAEADNDDTNMLHSGRDFEQTPPPAEIVRFTDSVPGQTKEVFNLLEKILPLLGREVLQGVCRSHSNNSKDEGVQEVLNSIPVLYAMLAFYRSTPPTSLRVLTSSVSEPPQFIHDLWQLVTTIRGENKVETIFDSIVNKTILDTPRNMDLFTSALLTFLASLHYRLHQLTDEEVDANPRPPENINSYGFTPNCLLSVGLRLRDFLLGVIDLLYPDRPPLRAKPDGSYAPVTLGDVIARVERQRMSDRSTTSPNKERPDEKARLIWCLHRWRSVFLATQQVIRLIYAWRRRRRRLQFEDWAIATSDPSNQETEPGIEWLCPSSMSSELAEARTAEWILKFCDDLKSRESTGAELGYFSCLNPDAADDAPMTSGAYIYWRKWTLIFELPFIFPFWDRVKLFVTMVRIHRINHQRPTYDHGLLTTRGNSVNLKVHRSRVYEDVFMALVGKPAETFLDRFTVTFYNEAGLMEMGIDGGGLCREMIVAVLSQGFDPSRGLFRYNDDHALYPNPDAEALMEDFEAHYIFLGAILAKAIYEGMLVDLQFAPFFLAKIISANRNLSVDFNHLRSLDAELYRQLCRLKSYQGDVSDLQLDFTIVQCLYGKNTVVDLKPNGSSIPVTNESRVEYVNLVANYKLNTQIQRQSMAFISGMTSVLDLKWLQLFDAEELQIVISGTNNEIDVDDWQEHTKYCGDITGEEKENSLKLFWDFVRSLNDDQKRKLIRFVTASSRPPMFGFEYLHPEFTIQITSETSHLPTSSTCSNLLKLPAYQTAEEMREKFLLAIESNAGFEFS